MIDKQKLQERLDTLRKERLQVEHNLYAYDGAIQDCEYWLQQIDSPETALDHSPPDLTPIEGGQSGRE